MALDVNGVNYLLKSGCGIRAYTSEKPKSRKKQKENRRVKASERRGASPRCVAFAFPLIPAPTTHVLPPNPLSLSLSLSLFSFFNYERGILAKMTNHTVTIPFVYFICSCSFGVLFSSIPCKLFSRMDIYLISIKDFSLTPDEFSSTELLNHKMERDVQPT